MVEGEEAAGEGGVAEALGDVRTEASNELRDVHLKLMKNKIMKIGYFNCDIPINLLYKLCWATMADHFGLDL